MGQSSRGGPGSNMAALPSFSIIQPGAVPFGFGRIVESAGKSTCFLLFGAIARPRTAKYACKRSHSSSKRTSSCHRCPPRRRPCRAQARRYRRHSAPYRACTARSSAPSCPGRSGCRPSSFPARPWPSPARRPSWCRLSACPRPACRTTRAPSPPRSVVG